MSEEENQITSWDYRLFRGEDGYITIGEVYYNGETPVAWSEDGVCPGGETVEEMVSELKKMLDAVQKPVFVSPKEN
jgi:hypothetical protein